VDNIRRSSGVVGGRVGEFVHLRRIHSPFAVDRVGRIGNPNHSGTKNRMTVARQEFVREALRRPPTRGGI
jgi:hypothetical protein